MNLFLKENSDGVSFAMMGDEDDKDHLGLDMRVWVRHMTSGTIPDPTGPKAYWCWDPDNHPNVLLVIGANESIEIEQACLSFVRMFYDGHKGVRICRVQWLPRKLVGSPVEQSSDTVDQ